MRMCRLLFTACLIFVSVASLPAADIVATGEGVTSQEARTLAYANLASQINVLVDSSATLSVSNDGGNRSELFVQEINVASRSEFPFVEVREAVKEHGTVSVTLTIPEDSSSLYLSKLADLLSDVQTYYGNLQLQAGNEEKLITISSLLYCYNLYNSYKTILLRQGVPDEKIQEFPWNHIELEAEYLQLLDSIERELVIREEAYSSGDLSIAKEEAEAELERISLLLQEVQEVKKGIEAEQKVQLEEMEKSASFRSRQAADELKALAEHRLEELTSAAAAEEDAVSVLELIESGKKEFNSLQSDLREQLAAIEESLNSDMYSALAMIDAAEYKAAELSDGLPTDRAVESREMQKEEIYDRYRDKYAASSEALKSSIAEESDAIRKRIEEQITRLESRSFHIDTAVDDSISLRTYAYDGNSYSWPFSVNLDFVSGQYLLSGSIPYQSVTGRSYDLNTEYTEYVDEIEVLNLFLLSGSALRAEVDFRIEADESKLSTYHFIVTSVRISRLDNDLEVYRESGPLLYDFEYSYDVAYDLKTDDEIAAEEREAELRHLKMEEAIEKMYARKELVRHTLNGIMFSFDLSRQLTPETFNGSSGSIDSYGIFRLSAEYYYSLSRYMFIGAGLGADWSMFRQESARESDMSWSGIATYGIIGLQLPFFSLDFFGPVHLSLKGGYTFDAGYFFVGLTAGFILRVGPVRAAMTTGYRYDRYQHSVNMTLGLGWGF